MANYGVVRTDKMTGTDNRAFLASVKYMGAGTTETAIENGNVVLTDGLLDTTNKGGREVYKGKTPAANSPLKDILLIATPEVDHDNTINTDPKDFRNEAGEICRGYFLHDKDIFSVTKAALDGASSPAIGNIVELKAGTKLNVVESLTASSTQVGKIIDINVVGAYTYYAIQVG